MTHQGLIQGRSGSSTVHVAQLIDEAAYHAEHLRIAVPDKPKSPPAAARLHERPQADPVAARSHETSASRSRSGTRATASAALSGSGLDPRHGGRLCPSDGREEPRSASRAARSSSGPSSPGFRNPCSHTPGPKLEQCWGWLPRFAISSVEQVAPKGMAVCQLRMVEIVHVVQADALP